MIFDSYGSAYLGYRDVDPSYPGWSDLAGEMDIEILTLLDEMLAERKLVDPELRISADPRCVMWEWHQRPAGELPYGTHIEIDGWFGTVRRATPREIEWDTGLGQTPRVYADLNAGRDAKYLQGLMLDRSPRLDQETMVMARLPVPLDRGSLLRLIDGEQPAPPAPAPPRITWDDIQDGQIIRYEHHNRSQRLAGRRPVIRTARVRSARPPGPGCGGWINITVLNRDGTTNRNINYTSIFNIDDVVSIVETPTATVMPQEI